MIPSPPPSSSNLPWGEGTPATGQGPTTLPGTGQDPVSRGWWSDEIGFRRALVWYPETGDLVLEAGHHEPAELLAVIPNRVMVNAILSGWQDRSLEQDSQRWLRAATAFLRQDAHGD